MNKYKSEIYSDGNIENEILEIFKSKDFHDKVEKILAENPTWAYKYHLSPDRENILNWYDFDTNGNLLEVGGGCGSLTGLFCRKVKKVVTVELSTRRSEIIKLRWRNQENLTVLSGNIQELNLDEKFDYITVIGVLEYSGMYIKFKDPYSKFIEILKTFLKPKGKLIIAIENKFGLKYWAGAPEDHTNRHFDSIENYPNNEGIKTFSNQELKSLLENAGLKDHIFYYPLPDYKFPMEIFSEWHLPDDATKIKPGIIPSYHSIKRDYLFDERLVMNNLISNNLFELFTNSYLVFSTND